MIGDNQNNRAFVEQFERASDLLIQMPIVVGNDILVRIAGLVVNVLLVVRIPKPMVYAVKPDINKVKVIPFLVTQEMPHHRPLLPAHLENLVAQPIFLFSAKSCNIRRIVTDQLIDLLLDLRRMSKFISTRIRRQET